MSLITIPESYKVVMGTAPVTTNGGVTCDYVSVKNAHRCTIVVQLDQAVGHATSLAVKRATAVDGTGAAAIATVVPIWMNADCAATDTLVAQTAAISQAVAADIKTKMVIFQVDCDTIGDYDVLGLTASDSSQATNFISVTYLLEERYPQATPPAAITD